MLNLAFNSLELMGIIVLMLAVAALLFSPYRHWLGFMLAGMGYFLFLEGVRFLTHESFDFGAVQGYSSGVGLSLLFLAVWFAATEEQRSTARRAERLAQQIEHQPVHMEEV